MTPCYSSIQTWCLVRILILLPWLIPHSKSLMGESIKWIIQNGAMAPERVLASGFGDIEKISTPPVRKTDASEPRLKIYVLSEDGKTKAPFPVLGSYTNIHEGLVFTPRFPFSQRMAYRAEFEVSPKDSPVKRHFASEWKSNAPQKSPTTTVTQIYPSSDTLPENLLKFYLLFSSSMSGGNVYDHIHLFDEHNQEVELPFLELGQELWDAPMKRLTLFIDPGRIKRGVKPLEDIGPSLVSGERYRLVIDADWKDAERLPLAKAFEKEFTVTGADRSPIDPLQWEITQPNTGTRGPLILDFGEPLDFGLAQRLIEVIDPSGEHIEGQITLTHHESKWNFTPTMDWKSDSYQIRIGTILEDLAGNNIGKPFEVDVFDNVQRWITHEYVMMPLILR